MNVSSSYIKKCIFELQELTEKDRPYTRLVFSKEFNFPVIGIPATIDNDIFGTSHTIGFDSATDAKV